MVRRAHRDGVRPVIVAGLTHQSPTNLPLAGSVVDGSMAQHGMHGGADVQQQVSHVLGQPT